MSNGTSGDINNIDVSGSTPKYRPYEKMRLVAHDLAQKAAEAYKMIEQLLKMQLHLRQQTEK